MTQEILTQKKKKQRKEKSILRVGSWGWIGVLNLGFFGRLWEGNTGISRLSDGRSLGSSGFLRSGFGCYSQSWGIKNVFSLPQLRGSVHPNYIQCLGPYLKAINSADLHDLGSWSIFCLFHPNVIASLLSLGKTLFFLLQLSLLSVNPLSSNYQLLFNFMKILDVDLQPASWH